MLLLWCIHVQCDYSRNKKLIYVKMRHDTLSLLTLYKLYAVRWGVSSTEEYTISTVGSIQHVCVTPSIRRKHIVSTVESVQYGPVTPSVRMCHIFSIVEGMQSGPATSSVRWRVCSTDQSHHQYRCECAVQDYQNCLRGSWWLYLSGKNDILQIFLL